MPHLLFYLADQMTKRAADVWGAKARFKIGLGSLLGRPHERLVIREGTASMPLRLRPDSSLEFGICLDHGSFVSPKLLVTGA